MYTVVPPEPITRHTAKPAAVFWVHLGLCTLMVVIRFGVGARGGRSAGGTGGSSRRRGGPAAVLHGSVSPNSIASPTLIHRDVPLLDMRSDSHC